ncbi:hypothetical protein SORBI_3002G383000 [Sorghum bicolor]|uniref:Uncharacterized protein n=1 Tax=Sorghum bicolor TaxID=4558 RepID=A0A1B6QFT0_SORBI|nr:hypothetical protein SORBI_3002G383000 [Sorghum bicolor]
MVAPSRRPSRSSQRLILRKKGSYIFAKEKKISMEFYRTTLKRHTLVLRKRDIKKKKPTVIESETFTARGCPLRSNLFSLSKYHQLFLSPPLQTAPCRRRGQTASRPPFLRSPAASPIFYSSPLSPQHGVCRRRQPHESSTFQYQVKGDY